jgi:hypothetical protein
VSGAFEMPERVDGELGYSSERARLQLTAIRDLLADPSRRAVRANAHDAGGRRTEWFSRDAAAWGIYGAIWRVTQGDLQDWQSGLLDGPRCNVDRHWLIAVLREQLPSPSLALIPFTDALPREQLVAFLGQAIAAA